MKTRTKKCKYCKDQFTPYNSLQKSCSKSECIRLFVAEAKEKQWKKAKKEKKAELMTVQDWVKIAQTAFNAFIRERDKGLLCISCGNVPKKTNAGHFWNANNHWAVRFDEDNVHLQCEYCNSFLSGNLLPYRANLIGKIGFERYDQLEEKARETRKFSIEELKEITATYKQKLKDLKNNCL